MAWCPNCKSEYEPHVRKCKECDVELVDQIDDNFEAESDETDNYIFENEVILVNVASSIEADIIISRLGDAGIPAYKGYESSGEYLNISTGFNYQGSNIYVSEELLNEAKRVLDEQLEVDTEDSKEIDNLDELESEYSEQKRDMLRIVIFMVIIVPVLILVATYLNK